ncbi:MAG: HlyC/CorC family transporter [Deltaproteobacteria bacterium]|nr:HlyC/CorC family transporter [Deltaproteobacteria bacterium]
MSLATLITLEVFALLAQGFFSGSEMALISVDRLALRKAANLGNRGAKLAFELLAHPERVLTTALVGTNLCVAFQATMITLYIFTQLGPEYDIYTVLILSPLTVLFGELIPKTIYQRYAEHLAPIVARPIRLANLLLAPATWVIGKYAAWLSRLLQPLQEAVGVHHRTSHRDELSYLLHYGRRETALKRSERRMIRRIFDFSKAEAKRALIPLVHLDMIEDTLTQAEALDAFLKYGHSRLPVYHERVDNIVGVVHVFDVFSEQDPAKPVTKLMQPAFFAPVSQQLDDLLYTMKKRGIQMAIVVDEYGGAVGALTLEDILEEIVGEIKDEYDRDSTDYRQLGEGEYLIHARMEISAINEQLKLDLPRGDYETLAGFLLQQFNRIPEEGDELYYKNLKFVIRRATNKAIEQVYVAATKPEEA